MKQLFSKFNLFVFFVVFIFGLLTNELWNSSKKIKIITDQKLQTQNSDQKISILEYNMMEQMASTGISVNQSSFLKNLDNRKKILSKLKSGPLLFVRISPLSCSICVDSTMVDLRKFITSNKVKSRVIILTSYNTKRDLILFRRLHQMSSDVEILNIRENEISLPVEKEKKPYLFIIDSTFISKSLFIPEKTLSNLTDLYLRSIKKKIVLNNN